MYTDGTMAHWKKTIGLALLAWVTTACLPDLEPGEELRKIAPPCTGSDCDENGDPPTQPSVMIFPTQPLPNDEMNCLVTLPSSAPGGGTVGYSVAWKIAGTLVEGAETTTLGTGHSGQADDTVTCEVTAYLVNHPEAQSAPGTAEVTLLKGNQPPSGHTASIHPDNPGAGDNLICVLDNPAIDPDEGDSISYGYIWVLQGVDQGENTSPFLGMEATLALQEWKCKVTAYDNAGASNDTTSNIVYIQ
jgi:hypothetical protein